MSQGNFVHLHVHTEYSMLDGAAKNGLLIAEAVRQGMPAIAMTDHGNMFGAYEFHQTASKHGVKPIIGIEAYVAPSSRRNRSPEFWSTGKREVDGVEVEGGKDVGGGGRYTHMTMVARDAEGLRNLFRLSTLASYDGYYMKPRMDAEIIAAHSEGIIATTGCPGGAVQTRLRLGQYDEAVKAAATYAEIFGRGSYFVELMDHGIDIERQVRDDLLKLAKQLDLPLLATNDSHYVTADQADAHDNLLCIGVGRTKDDPNRFRFRGEGYHVRTADEMRRLFRDLPAACDNTLLVSEMVSSYDEVFAHVDRMPQFAVPAGETQESWLRKELDRGLALRYGSHPSQDVLDRIETELAVIEPMGFASYFLIVADICRYARENKIPVGPGRGSATGSMVAYLTRITELDPIEHGLLFERFLNPERINPPDVDLDFDDRQRDKMVRYVTERYGDAYTAQVNTFNTIKAKAAIKDASRILGYPFSMGEKIVKAMPPDVQGKGVPLSALDDRSHDRYHEGSEIRQLIAEDPEVRRIVDTGRGLEGLTRGTGVHAAAVILSSAPLMDLLPLHMREDGVKITGFSYPQCEEMGLMKMDMLGLRNLGIIDHALKVIEANRGVAIDTLKLPLDDGPTYQLLARGDTLGVFQLDGGPMRSLLRQMAPTRFEDIAAVLALYRPGPMAANAHTNYAERKNGRQAIKPIHPELEKALEPILGTTYHLLVYQEQIMAVARSLAGYTLGGADLLRRAMGKKKPEILAKEYANFKQGMLSNGYSELATKALWDVMEPFSGYAFNKSHTAGYGLVSYWTAYLKANYPAEYMSALLQSVRDDKDKSAVYLAECRRMGIRVLPPDVNSSDGMFTTVGDDIRYGLAAIRNVGTAVVDRLVDARTELGPATSFYDFLDKAPLEACNKRLVESLIKAGAFDSLGHSRRALMEVFEQAIDNVLDLKRNQAFGQDDLFGDFGGDAVTQPVGTVPDLPDWDKRTKLAFEREMLGLYVSDHPLNGLDHVLATKRDVSLSALLADPREGKVTIAGMITSVTRRQNKKGELWASVTVEDLDASVTVLLFSHVYAAVAMTLATDTVVSITGTARVKEDAVEINGSNVTLVNTGSPESEPVTIALPVARVTPMLVERLKDVLRSHPGHHEVRLRLLNADRTKTFRLDPELRVATSGALMADLKALLGPACVA